MLKLTEVIDNKYTYIKSDSEFYFFKSLVISVKIHTIHGKARLVCGIKLSARNNIHSESLFFCNSVHGKTGKGLAGIENKAVSAVIVLD